MPEPQAVEPSAPSAAGARIAGRLAGAAILGAVMGAALTGIWHAAWHACIRSDEVCLGPPAAGIAAGILVVVVGSAAGFALLRVRPLRLAVPAAILIALFVVRALASAEPGAEPPALWAAGAVIAAVMASMVLAVTPGRSRVAGLVLLAALLTSAAIVPGKVHDHLQASEQRGKLAALGFPLMLPGVPIRVLEQAATSLHPATISALLSMQ